MAIESINITIERQFLESRYDAFHGDEYAFTNDLEKFLEIAYPSAIVEVELDENSGHMWVNDDDTHCLIYLVQSHIDYWLDIHDGTGKP